MALTTSEIDTKTMVPVCRQLATAYEAGLPITKVLEHVGRENKNPKIRRLMSDMHEEIIRGGSLADAAQHQSRFLSPFFVNLLAGGEKSGKLDIMLKDLADYYEDRLKMRREIVSALTYPVILMVIAWFLGTFSIGMVKVALAGFEGSGGGGVDGVMAYFGEWTQFQVKSMITFAFIFGAYVVLARLGMFKWISGWFATFIWPFSRVTRKFGMARFFRSLSLMLGSGIGVVQCIQQSAEVTGNPYIEKDLLKSIPRVQNGATLVEAFSGSRLMTPLAREMLLVGEESGRLDFQLNKAAQYHMDEARHAVKLASTIMTNLVMLGVFISIGGIVIYFWSSLYGGMMDGLGI
jgi:type IV pilus assembly protein PilC